MTEDLGQKLAPQRSWLERVSRLLLREPQDREQLITLLREAEQRKLLDSNALAMIEGVMLVSEMQVRDIMIPRSQMVAIDQGAGLADFLPIIIKHEHSRYPVLGENRDEVIGILLAKDLLAYTSKLKPTKFDIHHILRPAVFVPESKRLDVLLQEFRNSHNHMAIVVDEYGGIAGLVTIEDVLEQIVGDIADEYDVAEESYIKKHKLEQFIVKAVTPIKIFNANFNANFSDDEFDTIGGLVMQAFGYLPKRNESIVIGRFNFKVLHAGQRRIRLLKVVVESNDQRETSSEKENEP